MWEPQYPSQGLARKPHADISMIYLGDDYGGHNIPFPHPAPPKHHKMYDENSFVDLTNYKVGSRKPSKVDDKADSRKSYTYQVQALMPKGRRPPAKKEDDVPGPEGARKAPRSIGKRAPASSPFRPRRSSSQGAPASRPRRTKQASPAPTSPDTRLRRTKQNPFVP